MLTLRASALRAAVAAASLLGIGFLTACQKQDGPPPPGGPVPVTVVTLKSEPVMLRRELPGRLNAYLVAEVRPQVDGIVRERLFTEGARVQKGQPLYQLDDATYRADYESAVANLARAQATLVTAELNARRSAQLVKIDAVSKQDDEDATAALRQAQADIKAAQAAVDRAKVYVDYARITSPIAGRIGKSHVTQGALVTAKQEMPLATVQQLDPIYVDLTQASAEWLHLRRELQSGRLQGSADVPVTILLEDGTEYTQPGKLAFSDVTVDPATGSFSLRVLVPNPEYMLLPGMYVRAVVATGERPNGVLVPQQGVTRGPRGETSALVVGKDGKAEIRTVRVSQAIADHWLVEEGLAPGDRVIVEGLQKVQPGAPLQATERGAAAPAVAEAAAPPAPAQRSEP